MTDRRLRHIVEDDDHREQDDKHKCDLINALFDLALDVSAKCSLDKQQQDQAAIEDRDRKQVEDAQVEAEESSNEDKPVPVPLPYLLAQDRCHAKRARYLMDRGARLLSQFL